MHNIFRVAVAMLCFAVFSIRAYASPPSTFYMYGDDHWRQYLDLYMPTHGCGPYPLVIYIHGGGWLSGDSSQVAPFVDPLLARGFAIAAINYRWSFQAIFPAQIFDCKGAVRFLRANAATLNLDPNKFAVFGDSAGGHLTALLGTSANVASLEGEVGGNLTVSSAVQAAADFNGPTDLFAYGAIYNADDSVVSQLFGHPIQDIIDHMNDPAYADLVALVNSANPITHVTPNDPPFHITHGDADDMVPLSQSQILQNALVNAGVPSIFQVIPGGRHELPLEDYLPAFDFLAQRMNVAPRFADVNCDHDVNVADLLTVINAWGQCASDTWCQADTNGDGMVNVADLLAVINGWG